MCPNTYFSRMTCSLSRYGVEGELDCFNCKMGLFSDYSLQCLLQKAITIHFFCEKRSTRLWGILDNYKGKLSVPRVHTAALIKF